MTIAQTKAVRRNMLNDPRWNKKRHKSDEARNQKRKKQDANRTERLARTTHTTAKSNTQKDK